MGYMFLCAINVDVLGGNTVSELSRTVLQHEILKWNTDKPL